MSDSPDFGGPIVWRPTPEYIENAHLTRFMRLHGIPNFDELMRLSTQDIAWFTDAVLSYLDIRFYQPYTEVVDLSRGRALPEWCVGGEMNIVHNCLDKYIGTEAENELALIAETEDGQVCSFTYGRLWAEVNKKANALRSLGLGKGDAVGLFFPMSCEIVIAMLAVAKIGGVILPLFSGFGAGAIAARLNDAGAKALITADGASRRGKVISMKQVADEAAVQIPTLQHLIVHKRTDLDPEMLPGRDVWWHEIVSNQAEVCETERTRAEDLLMIIYTSGTTGRPKGAVHTHCGFPVKAAQDMAFGTDLHRGEVIYWMTDMGWMMGPWLVFGGLLLGGTIFLYDGAPDHPGPDRIWDMVERHRITTLGVSPTLIRSLIPHGDEIVHQHDLSSLKYFASTGEPWNPDPWMWLFENVGGGTRPIINYSGGTEISGGIVMGNPLLPLKACAFSGPCPGMAADVVNEEGLPVREQVGELVIRQPWIGMTRGFWKDEERYLDTYWSRWPDVWQHGDFALIDRDGQWYILGRSDDTIKIAGKRLGPAEVESILVSHPGVVEAGAIGIPHAIKGSELIVFCVPGPGVEPSEALRKELLQMVTGALGKPLAPKELRFVRDLPKTRNAKVMRRVLRAAYLGQDPGDVSSLVNPEVVEEIRQSHE
jgi:acetyl-CoA synthetase